MTLLAGHARIDTEYGGGFVSGINGVKSTFGGVWSAQAANWFYWVDGLWPRRRADYRLYGARPSGGTSTSGRTPCRSLRAFRLPGAVEGSSPGSRRKRGMAGIATVGASVRVDPGADELPGRRCSRRRPCRGHAAGGDRREVAPPASGQRRRRADGRAAGGRDLAALARRRQGPSAEAVALALPDEDNVDRPFLVVLAGSAPAAQRLFALLTPDALAARVAVALVNGRLVALPWHAQ